MPNREELGADNTAIMWETLAARTAEFHEQRAKELLLPPKESAANDRQVAGSHYKTKSVQTWDVVDQGPEQQAIGFYRYNALKYVMRAGEKGDFKEDIQKAQHYLEKLLELLG